MKKLMVLAVLGIFLVAMVGNAFAGWVNGYSRKNGTYVSGYYRSSPDGNKSNNYGPSRSNSERINPYGRDNDRDGVPNYMDMDDDNDGISDAYDSNQYGR